MFFLKIYGFDNQTIMHSYCIKKGKIWKNRELERIFPEKMIVLLHSEKGCLIHLHKTKTIK